MPTVIVALTMSVTVSEVLAQSSKRFAEPDPTPDDGVSSRERLWSADLLYDPNASGGEDLSGLPLVARQEVVRRQQNITESRNAVDRGDVARYEDEDLETAVAEYRKALDLLPDAPMTRKVRADIAKKYADTSVELAESRVAEGRYSEAISLTEAVLAPDVMPKHNGGRSLLKKLQDPQWFNRALSPDHVARVKLVEEALEKAMGYHALGDYDSAEEEYNRVLNIDPHNAGARRGSEKTGQAATKYYESAYDETRARFLREVMASWESGIPGVGLEGSGSGGSSSTQGVRDGVAINKAKLKSIIIPRIEFTDTPLEDAIEFLRQKSIELDVMEPDPLRKGMNIIIQDTAPAAAAAPAVDEFGFASGTPASSGGGGASPRVTLTLANIPLAEALRYTTEQAQRKVKVEAFAVKIVPLTDVGDELFTKTYRVPPSLLSLGSGGGGGTVDDPFASAPSSGGGSALVAKPKVKDVLLDKGVTFPPGSSAFFNPGTSQLVVRNTQSNMELIDSFVDSIREDFLKQLTITTKFIEISQDNREELHVDTLLGNGPAVPDGLFPRPFTVGNNIGVGGGTTGNVRSNGFSSGATTSDFPVGAGTPISGGLRSGTVAIAPNGIDQVISNSFSGTVTGTTDIGATPRQSAPAIFGITGVGNPSFEILLRGLSQRQGVDLVTAPSVTARSGQHAKVEVVREFIYPTEYDPPDIPNNIAAGGGSSAFPVTPANPTAFEERNVGVTLEVDPVIGADGYTIDLNLASEVVEFDGFLNYGSPITTRALGSPFFPGDLFLNPLTNVFTLVAPGTAGPAGSDFVQGVLPATEGSAVVLSQNRIVMPVFSTRRATTAVTVWDGQTVIMGGLIREDTQKVRDKVPIFGDLPVVGKLFRSRADVSLKRNLSILVTPKLIDPAGQPIRDFDALADAEPEVVQ